MPERWIRRDGGPIRGAKLPVQQAARSLRYEPTPAERTLWNALRRKQLSGIRFRRQHPIGRFILDFYAPACHLVVELDGGIHEATAEYDQERSEVLAAHGYRVVRFGNEEVLTNLRGVLEQIRDAVALIPRPPLPRTGEGEPDR